MRKEMHVRLVTQMFAPSPVPDEVRETVAYAERLGDRCSIGELSPPALVALVASCSATREVILPKPLEPESPEPEPERMEEPVPVEDPAGAEVDAEADTVVMEAEAGFEPGDPIYLMQGDSRVEAEYIKPLDGPLHQIIESETKTRRAVTLLEIEPRES